MSGTKLYVAVWGNSSSGVEAGILEGPTLYGSAEDAVKKFLNRNRGDPSVGAWVRQEDDPPSQPGVSSAPPPPIIEKPLLTVKVLSAKLAKQVRVIPIGMVRGGENKRASLALADGTAEVYGWVPYSALYGETTATVSPLRYWLVRFEGQLRWFIPPNGGVLAQKFRDLEQLFVS